jgi:para-aminobenzoate synthetase component 1
LRELIEQELNYFGSLRVPTLFVISYDLSDFYISPLDKLDSDIEFNITDKPLSHSCMDISYSFDSVSKYRYKRAFDKVIENIKDGNTYLTNLTFSSYFNSKLTLKELYDVSYAKFKLYFKDKFICFSPERFINIQDNRIYTYPMKGTIDADIKGAKERILNDKKEMAEHIMVVDLLRNDLSMVGYNIKVEEFRYIDRVISKDRELLQVSSKIGADLDSNWHERLGTIITSLLPAGSITGTPKKKTIEIIKEVEDHDREFFSGVFGIYDGSMIDSGVMIRFIQKDIHNRLIYKSGGGITIDSICASEYQEMIDKIYVPIF